MSDYIKRQDALNRFEQLKEQAESVKDKIYLDGVMSVIDCLPAANVREDSIWAPVIKNRPRKYITYKEFAVIDGEVLYKKKVYIDEKDFAEYCPKCGKQMCSRFNNFCPNCGARMKGGNENAVD